MRFVYFSCDEIVRDGELMGWLVNVGFYRKFDELYRWCLQFLSREFEEIF
jgi:hypothetical protein